MKKLVTLALVATMLSACSFAPTKHEGADGEGYTQSFNNIVVDFDKNGDWKQIIVTGQATFQVDTPAARTAAVDLAMTNARKHLSTYLTTSVNMRATTHNDQDNSAVSVNRTEMVEERSQSMLRGAQFTSRYEGDQAIVEVKISPRTIKAARQIQSAMK